MQVLILFGITWHSTSKISYNSLIFEIWKLFSSLLNFTHHHQPTTPSHHITSLHFIIAADMDITYIPAIAEIIQKCKAPTFAVCNKLVDYGKPVTEAEIEDIYERCHSHILTIPQWANAPEAVRQWRVERHVWEYFCMFIL
jgi:hypothetical protein